MKIKLILGTSILLIGSTASASIVQFNFEGYVSFSEIVDGPDQGLPIPSAPSANTPISGYYRFDTNSTDTSPDPIRANYNNVVSMSINLGSSSYNFSEPYPNARGIIEVENNASAVFPRDMYRVRVIGNDQFDFSGPSIGDFRFFNFELVLFDWGDRVDPDLLVDDSLPLTPPDLGLLSDAFNFGNNATTEIVFSLTDGQTSGKLRGEVTALTLASIPITPCETSTITCLHIPEVSNLDANDVESYTGSDSQLTLLYKSEFDEDEPNGGGDEFGIFKDNYSTEYITDADGEPTGADIFHDLGDIINCAECYLVVKDGRQGDPAQYLFDISDSGDLMTLALSGFWDGEGVKGSISNIAIYGASVVPVPAAVWLFGTALIGLVGFSKRRKLA